MKEYGKRHLLEFIWVGISAILFSALWVGISLVLQYAIDNAIAGRVDKAVYLSAGFIAVFAVVYWLQASSLVKLNQKVIRELRENIVRKLLYKDAMSFYQYKETDYISLVQNDVKKIEDTYLNTFFSIICALAQLIFAIIVMTHYSWVFTIVMAGMTALMFVVPAVFSKKLSKSTEAVSKAQQLLTEGISEVVLGYEVTKSFQKEKYRIERFQTCNNLMQRSARKLELLKQANGGTSTVLAFFMQMVICILAGWFIYQGRLSYGSMVGVIQASGSITTPLFQMFALIPVLKSFKPIWDKIAEYTRCEVTTKDNKNLEVEWREITLKDVEFAYQNEEKKVLRDINLKIERGKKYLIIGESGGGKTTLINILCGKLLPDKGELMVDGINVIDNSQILQQLSSAVWQNVYLFNESIADNILMGDCKRENFDEIISQASLDEMIDEKGIEFVVGTNGDQLSGGQKQRIAIARALYAEKDLLVLDEGFSALNPEMAQTIERNLLKQEDKTIISISHHVSNEMMALYDEILEVKNGKVCKI